MLNRILSFSLIALLAPSVYAQSAPEPTLPASQVLSIYSDAYTDVENTDFNPGWGQDTQVTNADGELTYSGLNYQGTAFGAAQDVSGYAYLHVDFYTDDSTDLGIYLVGGGVEVEYVFTVTPGQWNSVDIPLTAFNGVDLANAIQFKVEGNGTVKLDNLYFHGLVAPTPTLAADDVLSIYSDAYTDVENTDFNPNWGQATQVTNADGELTYSGLNYQGTVFGAAQDVSGYAYLHVDFYTDDSTDLGIYLVGGGVEVEYVFTVTPGQWNGVDIPLTAFNGVDLANAIQFKVEGNGTVKLDNLYFHGDPNAVPRGAAPTPTVDESGVISIYSDAYTDVENTDFNPGWGQATQVTNADGELTYSGLNYQGTVFGAAQDVSGYGYLHVDYYTEDSTDLGIFLIADGVEVEYVFTVTQDQWNSVDIPLTAFDSVNLANASQLKVVGNGNVVLDNIYFHGKPAAPAPTVGSEYVLSIYSDAYTDVENTDFNPPWGQATQVANANGELTYSSLNYQGTVFGAAQDVSGYDYLHVDFYTDDSTDLGIYLVGGGVEVEYVFTVTPGQWNSVDIPLTAFNGVDLVNAIQFKVEGNGNVRLDNLYFGRVPTSDYCNAPVTHFANDGGAALLTIANVDANSIKVSLTSSDENAVNAINVAGAAGSTFTDSTVGDALVRTLTWADGAPDNVSLNVMWGKEGTPGMVMLGEADITVASAAVCGEAVPDTAATFVLTAYDATSVSMQYGATTLNATDNGDGTWTAVIDPVSDASFEYSWIVDGSPEDLLTPVLEGECADDATAGTLTTDNYSVASRVNDGSVGTTSDRYNSCSGTVNGTSFTVIAENASSVKLNSSLNAWDAATAVAATDNQDGSWTVTIDPSPNTFEYLWIVGDNSENLSDNYDAGECNAEVAENKLLVNGSDVNRQWTAGSDNASDIYEACAGTPTSINPVVIADGVVSRFYNRGLLGFDGAWGWGKGDCDPLNPNDAPADRDCVSIEVTVESDSDHGDVMQVAFSQDTDAGVFAGIQGQTDFSQFAGGSITFDIKNVSGDSGLTYKIDSAGSMPVQNLPSVGANGWESVTISVNQLVASGLDLSTVTTGFVFWSTTKPATFQIDNLQWNTGNEAEVELPEVTFRVDMSDETPDAGGVYIAGGGFGNAGHALTEGENGIWSVTVEMDQNARATYKFRNRPSTGSDDWGGFENPVGLADCGVGQYVDRFVDVVESDIVLDVVAYGSCTALPYVPPVVPERPPAPVPSDASGSVLSIFGTTYGNLAGADYNPGWGQATAVVVDTDLEYSNLNFQGTVFPAQDVSGYEYLNVDYYVTSSTALRFFLIGGGETYYDLDVSTADEWVNVQIPLSAYSSVVNLAEVIQFKVDGNGSVAFNNLYFGGTVAPADTTAPVITLTGDAQVTVDLNSAYSDAGATADTGETVSVSGSVDTSTEGTYTLTYSATDDAGNEAVAVTRTVTVADLTDTDRDGIIDSLDSDDDNDGVSDVLEEQSGRDPLNIDYMTALGTGHTCAMDDDGVKCWGSNVNDRSTVPALVNPVYIDAGTDFTCAIDDAGVSCWGKDAFNKLVVPSTLVNPRAVAAGKDHACALDDNGVTCWGRNGSTTKQREAPELSNPTQISSSLDHTCAIDDTGVVCWGSRVSKRRAIPDTLVNPTQVAAGYTHTCALDDNGVTCWGSSLSGKTTVPTLVNPTSVVAGGRNTCAIDDTGVVCWGSNNVRQLEVPALSNPSHLAVGRDHACAVDEAGIHCWGGKGDRKHIVPSINLVTDLDGDGVDDWKETLNGTDKTLADTDGDGVEDGADRLPLDSNESLDSDRDGTGNNADADDDNDGIPDALEELSGRDPVRLDYKVSVGLQHTCALDGEGVKCWGSSVSDRTTVPALVNPSDIEAGYDYSCAIDDYGVTCWGKDTHNETQVPSTLSNPFALAAGKDHVCALDDNGATCWGRNGSTTKQREAPVLSNPTQISSSMDHTCAIDDTGVVCWGSRVSKRRAIPDTLVNPTQVAAGYTHTCALDDNGVTCWGSSANGKTTVPTLVNPTSVVAGGRNTCAIDDNGVVCWGADNRRQTQVPVLSNPTQLTAGRDHICALDDEGVTCWGDNRFGKRNVPALSIVKDNDGDGVDDSEDSAPLDSSIQ